MNYQIQTLNAISPAIYTQLGEHYHVSDHAEQPDASRPMSRISLPTRCWVQRA